jgi:hypothetical protein
LEELMKKCQFSKEDFYSNDENKIIDLICELNEKGKLEKIDNDIEITIQEIWKDFEGEILIKKLEEFLENEERIAIKRLGLIKIISKNFEPKKLYKDLKDIIGIVKEAKSKLSLMEKYLIIFHGNTSYQNDINKISIYIQNIQEKSLKILRAEKNKIITNDYDSLIEQIKAVKDFLLFKVLYDEENENDEGKCFNNALQKLNDIKTLFDSKTEISQIYEKNKNIFNKIKEMISNNESKAEKFIKQMIDYFKITDKKLIEGLKIIFKSKKYEMDLNIIIYFFENLNIQNYNNKDNWIQNNIDKYKNLSGMNLKDIEKSLEELKKNEIYDYEKKNEYFKLFNSLFNKKEAIDFLLSKTNQNTSKIKENIISLYDKIEPSNRIVTMKDIQDTEKCIIIFNEFKELKENSKIFEHIKKLNEDQISKFENYSKNYS